MSQNREGCRWIALVPSEMRSICHFEFSYWLLVIGYWLLVIGYWLLVIGYWLLVISYWLLVIGYW
jgi:hypothetical protein